MRDDAGGEDGSGSCVSCVGVEVSVFLMGGSDTVIRKGRRVGAVRGFWDSSARALMAPETLAYRESAGRSMGVSEHGAEHSRKHPRDEVLNSGKERVEKRKSAYFRAK